MPAPRVAIIGRPNVGKSSLLNLIAGRQIAIVAPQPGVTRDRVSVVVDLTAPDGEGPTKPVELVDTGGFGLYQDPGRTTDETGRDLTPLWPQIERQIALAIESADLILLCVDCQAGVTPQDEQMAEALRRGRLGGVRVAGVVSRVPIRVVATKCDGPRWEAHALEAASLGFGAPICCSARTGYLRRHLLDELWQLLPAPDAEPARPDALHLAIVGKRNAGKSTLVNALAGQERVIVSEIPGTTRDAIDVRIDRGERSIVLIDTAGVRRRKSLQGEVEWYAFDRARRAVRRADVVLLLIDATVPVSQVDEQLARLVHEAYKPVVLVVNKWDLVSGRRDARGRPIGTERYERYLRRALGGLAFAPISFISAATGLNLEPTLTLAQQLHTQARTRVGTGELNRVVREILEGRSAASGAADPDGAARLGGHVKVFYAAQVAVDPPTIVLVVSRPRSVTRTDQRFLLNRFRERLPYDEVPIRLLIRGRTRSERRAGGGEIVEPETGGFVDDGLMQDGAAETADAYFDDDV